MSIERKSETTFELDGRENLVIRTSSGVEVHIKLVPQSDPRVEVGIHYPTNAQLATADVTAEYFQAIVRTSSDKPRLTVSR